MPQIHRKRSRAKVASWTLVGLFALLVVFQFVPYGRDHTERPGTHPFQWSSVAAEGIAKAACYDCHSSETKWWWGVQLAPFSWLAQHDINGAKRRVNFSEWNGAQTAAGIQQAINRNMPPLGFTLFHPHAKLTDTEKQTLVQGFQASLAKNSGLGTVPAAADTVLDTTVIINARCSSCHSPGVALRFRASSTDQAKILIDRMVQQGATITTAERQALIDRFIR